MRRNAKVDENQPEIVDALTKAGATVQYLYMVGGGCGDILAGYKGRNILLEIKRPLGGKLTTRQKAWHAWWEGQITIVESAEEALEAIGAPVYLCNGNAKESKR